MRNPARIYQYAISFFGLQAVLWGLVALARLWFAGRWESDPDHLAQALSLIVIGGFVLGPHWWLIRRAIHQDAAERKSSTRAVFLFVTLLALLLPAAMNVVALANRSFLWLFSVSPARALVGGEQTWGGNLAALALFLSIAYGLWRFFRSEGLALRSWPGLYRLFWWFWWLFGLLLSLVGAQVFLQGSLQSIAGMAEARFGLANGLALLLTGLPLLLYIERRIRPVIGLPLVSLTGLAFFLLAAAMAASGWAIAMLIRTIWSGSGALNALLLAAAQPISAALPLAAASAYYNRLVWQELSAGQELRHIRLRRAYLYALAALGVAGTLFGMRSLLAAGLASWLGQPPLARLQIARWAGEGLAALIAGLPAWIIAWLEIERTARRTDERGDRARRSLFRRAYLYTALFVGAAGSAITAGALLYRLLNRALHGAASPPLEDFLWIGHWVLPFVVLLAYHSWILHRDSRATARKLAARHAKFPVLVLAPGPANGSVAEQAPVQEAELEPEEAARAEAYINAVVSALLQQSPALPVAVHPFRQGVPDETLSAARAVIVPAELLARPTEGWRVWLQNFPGRRVVIPTPAKSWYWVGGREISVARMAQQAALMVRRMAEGDEPED